MSSSCYICVLTLLYTYIRVDGAAFYEPVTEPDVCAADADDAKNGKRLARADGQNGAPLDRHG